MTGWAAIMLVAGGLKLRQCLMAFQGLLFVLGSGHKQSHAPLAAYAVQIP